MMTSPPTSTAERFHFRPPPSHAESDQVGPILPTASRQRAGRSRVEGRPLVAPGCRETNAPHVCWVLMHSFETFETFEELRRWCGVGLCCSNERGRPQTTRPARSRPHLPNFRVETGESICAGGEQLVRVGAVSTLGRWASLGVSRRRPRTSIRAGHQRCRGVQRVASRCSRGVLLCGRRRLGVAVHEVGDTGRGVREGQASGGRMRSATHSSCC